MCLNSNAHLNPFPLNQKDLEEISILRKNFSHMHIACCNMHIVKESILRLTYVHETIEVGDSELGGFLGGSLPPTIFLYSRHYPIFSYNPNLISHNAFFFFSRQLFESNFMNLGKFFEGTRDSSPSPPRHPPPITTQYTTQTTSSIVLVS